MSSLNPSGLIKLTGIARLAAEGETLIEKSRVEYRTLPTRKWLNHCNSRRVPFDWTINPYRGCEYGCKYCYARFTHQFLELHDPTSFETEIYAKDWNAGAFRKELASLRPGAVIGLGTATDPYQPAERKFGRTRQVLECLLTVRGICLFVTTKSDLVARDVELFKALSLHNDVRIALTITTLDSSFARQTEPFAPRPDLRLDAVRVLVEAGVSAGVIASPVLPLLTDSPRHLRSVAEAAKTVGATYFGAGVLFLKPAAQKVFFAFLAEKFPQLLSQYQAAYRGGAYLRGGYPVRVANMVNEIRLDLGFRSRETPTQLPPAVLGSQLRLF